MGEVLSQDEIDNLLKALSTGELDADEMKTRMNARSKIMILHVRQNSRKNI